MSDRELLEDAAKAAGYGFIRWETDEDGVGLAVVNHGYWQPLYMNTSTSCDGDALRLAVKLKFHVGINPGNKVFCTPTYSDKPTVFESCERDGVQDPLAATRRAIVRAAAEIGRQMP